VTVAKDVCRSETAVRGTHESMRRSSGADYAGRFSQGKIISVRMGNCSTRLDLIQSE
jgi:hypothetical protein